MLRSTKELLGYHLTATDGTLGKVKDFYFDDFTWTVRYMVADTGKWLPGRKVLVSPQSLGKPTDWAARSVPVSLTKKQVEDSPSIRADLPVSRQHEVELARFFRWAPYWGATGVGMGVPIPIPAEKSEKADAQPHGDPHLRSFHEVLSYHIQATDATIGHVEDLIVDTNTWVIRYMVVDTRNWLPGRKVLVSPGWIESVHWAEDRVRVKLTTDVIRDSPVFDPREPVNREYEARLYDYYGRPKYWERDVQASQPTGVPPHPGARDRETDGPRVGDVMTPAVAVVDAEATLVQAAAQMRERDIGLLVVMTDGEVRGVLTDRDIVVQAVAAGRDLTATKVRELMSLSPATCRADAPVEEAARLMAQGRVRRLIVRDEQGAPVGVLSLGDLAARAGENELVGATLAQIRAGD